MVKLLSAAFVEATDSPTSATGDQQNRKAGADQRARCAMRIAEVVSVIGLGDRWKSKYKRDYGEP